MEGAEVEVFRGAEKLLESRHPLIVCELHSKANEMLIREHFERMGYALKSMDELHLLAVPQTVAK